MEFRAPAYLYIENVNLYNTTFFVITHFRYMLFTDLYFENSFTFLRSCLTQTQGCRDNSKAVTVAAAVALASALLASIACRPGVCFLHVQVLTSPLLRLQQQQGQQTLDVTELAWTDRQGLGPVDAAWALRVCRNLCFLPGWTDSDFFTLVPEDT